MCVQSIKVPMRKKSGNFSYASRILLIIWQSHSVHIYQSKFWKLHSTKQLLYDHLPPIPQPIQVRPTKYVGYSSRGKNEFISDVFLSTPTPKRARVVRSANTCIHQLLTNTGYREEDLPEAMDDRDGWRGRERHNQRKRKSVSFMLSTWLNDNDDDIHSAR